MEKEDPSLTVAKTNIRNLFAKIDAANPSLTYDFIVELLRAYNKNINLNEMILRSEKFASSDGIYLKFFFLNKYMRHSLRKSIFFSCFERIFYKTSRIQGVKCKSQTTQANIEQNTGRNKRSQSVFGNNQVNARCFLYIMKSCTNFKQRSIILYTCVTN